MSLKRLSLYHLSIGAILSFASMGIFTSCDNAIYDDLEECRQGVEMRFVYDYNMEFANAFYSQVDCLTVFVYDGEGNYVQTRTEQGAILQDENYRMTFDLPAGKYNFIAYGGMECDKGSFEWTSDPAETGMKDLKTRMKPECITEPVGTDLHPLFYGNLEMDVTDDYKAYQTATLYMIKDTNDIRIVLQQADGEPVSHEFFDFKITDDNTLMGWDNGVIPAGTLEYMPRHRGDAVAGIWGDEPENDTKAVTGTEARVAFAEFSTARFVTGNKPQLTITRKDGHEVLSIPMINYLLLMKSEKYHDMPPQEFLDRESRWNMIFFLDRNHTWIKTHIVINGWVVRLNNLEM